MLKPNDRACPQSKEGAYTQSKEGACSNRTKHHLKGRNVYTVQRRTTQQPKRRSVSTAKGKEHVHSPKRVVHVHSEEGACSSNGMKVHQHRPRKEHVQSPSVCSKNERAPPWNRSMSVHIRPSSSFWEPSTTSSGPMATSLHPDSLMSLNAAVAFSNRCMRNFGCFVILWRVRKIISKSAIKVWMLCDFVE